VLEAGSLKIAVANSGDATKNIRIIDPIEC
jgi:hypothetical protein